MLLGVFCCCCCCRNVKCPCSSSTRRFVRSLCLYTTQCSKSCLAIAKIWFFALHQVCGIKICVQKSEGLPWSQRRYCVVSFGALTNVYCPVCYFLGVSSIFMIYPIFTKINISDFKMARLIMNGFVFNWVESMQCKYNTVKNCWSGHFDVRVFFASAAASLVLPMKPDRQHFWDESKRQEEEEGRRRRRRRGFLIMSDVWANSLLCSCRLLVG